MKRLLLVFFAGLSLLSCKNKKDEILALLERENLELHSMTKSDVSNDKNKKEIFSLLEDIPWEPMLCSESITQFNQDKARMNGVRNMKGDTSVSFDYNSKSYEASDYLANFLLKGIHETAFKGYLFAKFSIDKTQNGDKVSYHDFGVTLYILNENHDDNSPIDSLSLNSTGYKGNSKNLEEVYDYLHNNKKYFGFSPSKNKQGVIFKLESCSAWVGKNYPGPYYFYPSFNLSFTNLIISRKNNLREIDVCMEQDNQIDGEADYAGDNGGACCPPPP